MSAACGRFRNLGHFWKSLLEKQNGAVLAAFVLLCVLVACAESSRHGQPKDSVIHTEITVQPEKKGRGRTADEVFYQYALPSKKWVQTNIAVRPNQEVIVHHFTFEEALKVNIGGYSWTIDRPGTALPILAVMSCPPSHQIPQHYRCIELSQSETIKLFSQSDKSMKVGVLLKEP
jgi:hypothetical protein